MIGSDSNLKFQSCPICESNINPWRTKKVDSIDYNIDLCSSCSFAFVNPRPSFNFLMEFYSSFGQGQTEILTMATVLDQETLSPNATLDARRMIETIATLKQIDNNKFLDVGCGFGFFSKEALDMGYEVVPLEMAENEREIAEEMTGLKAINTSFEDYKAHASSMSVVFMSQILEHALDVNLWVSKAREMLENNGILAIALPNFGSIFRLLMQEKEPFITPPAHLNFFNPKSLIRLLTKHGFEVEEVQYISRIPRNAFLTRMPRGGLPLLPVAYVLSDSALRVVDRLKLGMMINVYARKSISRL